MSTDFSHLNNILNKKLCSINDDDLQRAIDDMKEKVYDITSKVKNHLT